MNISSIDRRGVIGTAIAAALAVGIAAGAPAPGYATPPHKAARKAIHKVTVRHTVSRPVPPALAAVAPTQTLTLSLGRGQLVPMAAPISDIFVASDAIADVQVKSANQIYVFGKGAGETTIYATSKSGTVVWAGTVRVGQGLSSVNQMLTLAMPDAHLVATPMNGVVLLTGTVASPEDVAEAARLTQAFVGDSAQVISRIKAATPLQVNLQVKIVEVSRSFIKNIGVNLLTQDHSGGFLFGVGQGNAGTISTITGANDPSGLPKGSTLYKFAGADAFGTAIGLAGHAFGLDLLTSLNLAEQDGFVTTLANPNLTALSGETASFLAGGEIPIPISQGLGAVGVEYKQYGVSLSFTPFVLADGRISMRVRPEVSQLTSAGSVTLNKFNIPGLTTRRAETTVELGSGQSLVIGGLLSNTANNSIDKAPFLGDLPILGTLFRSTSYKRDETELVIVVTPYLVKPVSANQIALPTDGYKAPTDAERVLLGQTFSGKSGTTRPMPTVGGPVAVPPGAVSGGAVPPGAPGSAQPQPGFSFNK